MRTIRDILSLLAPDKRSYGKLWATYSLTWLPLAANGANLPASFTTQNSSDFLALTMRAYVTTTATPPVEVAAPQATVLFVVGTNNLQPDGTPIHLGLFNQNTGKDREWELDFPIYIGRNTTCQGTITDLSGAASNVRIVFGGIRLLPNVLSDLG